MLISEKRNRQTTANKTFGMRLKSDLKRNCALYCIMIPVIIWYLYFQYKPILGIQIAFKNFNMTKGIWLSPWVGLNNFRRLFADPYFMRNIRNTIVISLSCIVFAFPAPILLALMINEVKQVWFKKTVQTLSYLPHFISIVVICGMITDFVAADLFPFALR